MLLSDEQMGAVRHGFDKDPDWQLIDLPAGPQLVPAWVTAMHVRWMDSYGNAPSFALRVTEDARSWPDKVFEQEGVRYIARHPDGRAECYQQSGALRLTKLRRWQRPDGSFVRAPYVDKDTRDAGGDWGEWEVLATPQEEGFGGAHIDIVLADGRDVVLRGPWHGPSPLGFQECAYVNVNDRWMRPPRAGHPAAPWHNRGGIGGLLIQDDVFIRMFARFLPHLQLVRVGKFLQPLKPEWDAPKHVVQARERAARP